MNSDKIAFRAYLQDGCIIEWYKPQTYSHVRTTFKLAAAASNCQGLLYAEHRRISTTGHDNGKGWPFPFHPDLLEANMLFGNDHG